MQLSKKTSIIISIIVLGLNSVFANNENKQDTCEVLLIGSSYFNYNNLRDLIENIADSSKTPLYIEMHGQNGLYLADHASSTATEAKINERDWDYIVLQGVGMLVAYPDSFPNNHPVYPALVTLRDKIYANCEFTRMVFQLPWAFEDGMTWYQNWTDTYEEMQIHIYNNTLLYSEEIGFEIAPVGWAWYAVLQEYNYPLHYLHLSDWSHPSLKGSYLMACAIYSAIFQESTVGNTYNPGLTEEEVVFFQTVASDTILNNLELWNITPLISTIAIPPKLETFNLHQNYPNPASHTTTIRYSIPKELPVKISVFNSLGNKIVTLLDRTQLQGKHEIEFETLHLTKGFYFYQMTAGSYYESKTMIIH